MGPAQTLEDVLQRYSLFQTSRLRKAAPPVAPMGLDMDPGFLQQAQADALPQPEPPPAAPIQVQPSDMAGLVYRGLPPPSAPPMRQGILSQMMQDLPPSSPAGALEPISQDPGGPSLGPMRQFQPWFPRPQHFRPVLPPSQAGISPSPDMGSYSPEASGLVNFLVSGMKQVDSPKTSMQGRPLGSPKPLGQAQLPFQAGSTATAQGTYQPALQAPQPAQIAQGGVQGPPGAPQAPGGSIGPPWPPEAPLTPAAAQEEPIQKISSTPSFSTQPAAEARSGIAEFFSPTDPVKRLERYQQFRDFGNAGQRFQNNILKASRIRAGLGTEDLNQLPPDYYDRHIEELQGKLQPSERAMLQGATGFNIPEDTSIGRFKTLAPFMEQALKSRAQLDILTGRAQQQDRTQNDRNMRDVMRTWQTAKKPLETIRQAIDRVRNLLAGETGTGDRGATGLLPKVFGDAGQLSTFDVKRWQQRMGIMGLYDQAHQAFVGTIAPEHRKELIKMLGEAETSAENEENIVGNRLAKSFSQAYRIPEDKLRQMLVGDKVSARSKLNGQLYFGSKEVIDKAISAGLAEPVD